MCNVASLPRLQRWLPRQLLPAAGERQEGEENEADKHVTGPVAAGAEMSDTGAEMSETVADFFELQEVYRKVDFEQ